MTFASTVLISFYPFSAAPHFPDTNELSPKLNIPFISDRKLSKVFIFM